MPQPFRGKGVAVSAVAQTAHDALLPPVHAVQGGQGLGAMLSVCVHAGLLAALTVSVDWHMRDQDPPSAELWAAVPQAAEAAPAPEPVRAEAARPAPSPTRAEALPKVDIAIEQDRSRQRALDIERQERDRRELARKDKERLEAEQRRAQEEERQARADEERLSRQREENLRRMLGQAGAGASGAAPGAGAAAKSSAPSAAYAGQVIARVRPNIVFTGTVPPQAAAEVEVTAASGGSIIARRLIKSSGHADWDEAVLRAIDRTTAMPRDSDGRVPQTIIIAFRRD